ncbi:MAG: NAD-dependent epimerase/dehydratase family protein [Bacteroidetes bacterium]|nr:NAD-dependent epimerase/dehydratase family protein [Bacteroidota bacterium]
MIYIYSMILVTGGTGLIGAHLLHDLIKKGERVRALRRTKSNLDEVRKIFAYYSSNADELFSKIEWVEGEMLDIFSLAEAMIDVRHVYHCSAIVSLNPKHGERMIHTNLTGTANMVNVALEKKIQKFCHVSSVAALGIEFGKEITEETYWNEKTNFSAYAISKYLSENEVWRASQEGLNMVIVNPSVVVGPGNWRRSSGDIFLSANKGFRWYTSGGIGYVDVRDVVRAMTVLMNNEIKNEKFILSSENLPYKKFMEMVYSSLGKAVPDKKAGKFILEIAWRLDKLQSSLTNSRHILTREIAKYSQMNLSYSSRKFQNAFQFEFMPVLQSVNDTVSHFLADSIINSK